MIKTMQEGIKKRGAGQEALDSFTKPQLFQVLSVVNVLAGAVQLCILSWLVLPGSGYRYR